MAVEVTGSAVPARENRYACPPPERLAEVVLLHSAAADKAIVGRNPHVYVRGYVIAVPRAKAAEFRKALKEADRLRAEIVLAAAKERYALSPAGKVSGS